jgi:tRNA(His) guanylyltransferase
MPDVRTYERDALGARMKGQYEHRFRTFLPRRTYTILRLDGKAFHTYTRGLERPFDQQLMDDMAKTAQFLCQEISGTVFAYTQSDEISLLLTDFATTKTQAWFDGNVQKMVSVSAALATAKFNELRPGKLAFFDSRAFIIPDRSEVANYFVWRQQDATRNSISMAAQAHFSHRELHRKSSAQMQDMLHDGPGINWNDYPARFKRGTVVCPVTSVEAVTYHDRRFGQDVTVPDVERRVWALAEAPIFARTEWLTEMIDGFGCQETRAETQQTTGSHSPRGDIDDA